jgi:hypothetical protein
MGAQKRYPKLTILHNSGYLQDTSFSDKPKKSTGVAKLPVATVLFLRRSFQWSICGACIKVHASSIRIGLESELDSPKTIDAVIAVSAFWFFFWLGLAHSKWLRTRLACNLRE